ncbi:helix-turn-helix domain-containing protein [Mycolicibacterium sp. XJ879]
MKQLPGKLREAVDVPTAARVLSVHPVTIRRWITAGTLPAHYIGAGGRRYVRIWVDDLAKIADQGPVVA